MGNKKRVFETDMGIILLTMFCICWLSIVLVIGGIFKTQEKEFTPEVKLVEEVCWHDLLINPVTGDSFWIKTDDCVYIEKKVPKYVYVEEWAVWNRTIKAEELHNSTRK